MELNFPGGGGLLGLFRELCDFRQPAGEEGRPDEGALRRGRSELIDFPLFWKCVIIFRSNISSDFAYAKTRSIPRQ